jgi:threonine dehydratase
VRVPVPEALEDMRGLVDDAILVSEDTIIAAMRLLHSHAGIVAEPSGAVGVAAMIEQPKLFDGQCVGTIICGSNLTMEQMQAWLYAPV